MRDIQVVLDYSYVSVLQISTYERFVRTARVNPDTYCWLIDIFQSQILIFVFGTNQRRFTKLNVTLGDIGFLLSIRITGNASCSDIEFISKQIGHHR
ncbi:hypothetical protein D3C86_1761410 [compost metagenome]